MQWGKHNQKSLRDNVMVLFWTVEHIGRSVVQVFLPPKAGVWMPQAVKRDTLERDLVCVCAMLCWYTVA